MEKGHGSNFCNITEMDIASLDKDETVDGLIWIFNEDLSKATAASIPMSSDCNASSCSMHGTRVCIVTNAARKKASRRFQRTRLVADKITCYRARARATLVKNRARRTS